jgi:hypothetical protein
MNLGLRLALYVFITAGLVASLAGGVSWLVTPDPSLQQPFEAKAVPVPPRIAESTEKVVVPVQEPQPARAAPSAPLQEAPVALPIPPRMVAPKPTYRAVTVTRGTKPKEKEPPTVQTYVVPVVITARTDAPF